MIDSFGDMGCTILDAKSYSFKYELTMDMFFLPSGQMHPISGHSDWLLLDPYKWYIFMRQFSSCRKCLFLTQKKQCTCQLKVKWSTVTQNVKTGFYIVSLVTLSHTAHNESSRTILERPLHMYLPTGCT